MVYKIPVYFMILEHMQHLQQAPSEIKSTHTNLAFVLAKE